MYVYAGSDRIWPGLCRFQVSEIKETLARRELDIEKLEEDLRSKEERAEEIAARIRDSAQKSEVNIVTRRSLAPCGRRRSYNRYTFVISDSRKWGRTSTERTAGVERGERSVTERDGTVEGPGRALGECCDWEKFGEWIDALHSNALSIKVIRSRENDIQWYRVVSKYREGNGPAVFSCRQCATKSCAHRIIFIA